MEIFISIMAINIQAGFLIINSMAMANLKCPPAKSSVAIGIKTISKGTLKLDTYLVKSIMDL